MKNSSGLDELVEIFAGVKQVDSAGKEHKGVYPMTESLTAEETAELIKRGRQLVEKKNLTAEEMVELMKKCRQLEKEGYSLEKISKIFGLNPEESLIL